MISGLSFQASMDDWVKETNQRMTAVFREASQRVALTAARNVPVDTGFARASVRASLSGMPSIVKGSKGEKGQVYGEDFGQVSAVIAHAEIGDTIYVGWTASYILPLEYGHSKQAPAGFVRLAAAQWQVIVDQVTAEARVRVVGRSGSARPRGR
jgi:hypothetical protein